MKKLVPTIVLAILLMLMILSWNSVTSYNATMRAAFNKHIKKAEELEEKEIYIDAVKEYEYALKIKPKEYDVAKKIYELYEVLEKPNNYVRAYKKAIKIDPEQKEPYLKLLDYYIRMSAYAKANDVLYDAWEHFPKDEELTERLIALKGNYVLAGIDVTPAKNMYFPPKASLGYVAVIKDGKYGLTTNGFKLVIKYEYDDIGILDNKLVPVKKDGEYYFLDNEGYRKLVPDEPADYFGSFGDGYAPACFNGVYGYVNNKLKTFKMEYDYAGCFANKIAAVQKDGKWGIINSSFKKVVGFEFDEVLMDDYGFCSGYGVFFAKKDGSYALYNTKGKKISDDFEEVRIFASDQPAAVKKDGKWCLVNKKGEIVLETDYDDMKSMCVGYAPVLKDGKWGAIDQYGNVLIDFTFEEMDSFMGNGYARVVVDGAERHVLVHVFDED